MWRNARGKKGGEIELIKVKMRLLLEKESSAKASSEIAFL